MNLPIFLTIYNNQTETRDQSRGLCLRVLLFWRVFKRIREVQHSLSLRLSRHLWDFTFASLKILQKPL